MSTTPTDHRPTTFYTPSEIEAALASAPHPAVTVSCQALCDDLQNDMDILQNLSDFPVKQRGRIRQAILAQMRQVTLEMKQQHCPPCDPM